AGRARRRSGGRRGRERIARRLRASTGGTPSSLVAQPDTLDAAARAGVGTVKRFLITILTIVVVVSTVDYARSDDFNGFFVLAGVIIGFLLLRELIG
ncbi:hypothetical protein, partial [Nocardia arizonensis]|uniref:hypothetical protein n=1 Tax=Nocardia arizonensis TaxID=1141647 RepID=UPI001C3FC288